MVATVQVAALDGRRLLLVDLLDLDGKPTGKISVHEEGAMPVDDCARQILQAVAMRKREVVMTLQGKLVLWMRLIAPGAIDRATRKETE